MIGLFISMLVVGIILVITGMVIDTYSELDFALAMLGLVMVFAGFLGTIITTSVESDKKECLKATAEISGKETKWLNGECYMQANDGKFVPQEWIEKGYNDK